MKQTIYVVGKASGVKGPDGQDLIIMYDVALSRAAAEVKRKDGTEIFKMVADNLVRDEQSS
jgi:hypothetical protein